MTKKPQICQTKDMSELVIRSLEKSDAPQVVSFMTLMYAESPFLTRYSDEWEMSIEDEASFLENAERAKNRVMLGGFLEDDLVVSVIFPLWVLPTKSPTGARWEFQ